MADLFFGFLRLLYADFPSDSTISSPIISEQASLSPALTSLGFCFSVLYLSFHLSVDSPSHFRFGPFSFPFLLYFFEYWVSLCSLGWPGMYPFSFLARISYGLGWPWTHCAAEGNELLMLLSSVPKYLEFMWYCNWNPAFIHTCQTLHPGFHTHLSNTTLLELRLPILVSFFLVCLIVESVGLNMAIGYSCYCCQQLF